MVSKLVVPFRQHRPFLFSRHNNTFSLFSTIMPCSSSKTLTDFFPKSNLNPNPNKRLKTTSMTTTPTSTATATVGDGCSHIKTPISDVNCGGLIDGGSSSITTEQRMMMELKKSLALSKRNLRICSDKLQKSQAEGGNGYVKLEELLVEESWLSVLSEEFEKPYAKNLCKFVESEICCGKVPIFPPQQLIFNALNSTPFDKVKIVILGQPALNPNTFFGQDPYHGPGQAMGLSFSVPEGIKIPSSLGNIFKELKQDLGCSIPSHGNLERWAVQGVLLLNTVLTVRNHQANSHAKRGWEQFTDAVIRTVSEKKKGIVFLLWGNSAQDKSRLIDETKHHILKSAHPSGLSANRGFFGCRHFSKTNQILEKNGELPINWQL